MSVELKGFDEFQKKLKKMAKAAKELEGENKVSFDELFTSSFMQKYTNFATFDELLTSGGFIVNSQEDFEAIPDEEFDKHISTNTKFKSWEKMFIKAMELYAAKRLGF